MKTFSYTALIVILSAITSCQQRMYFPDRANTPGLREGLEGKLTLAVKPHAAYDIDSSQRGNALSFGADLAFSPINHLGIIASYRSINHRVIREDYDKGYDVYGGDFSGHRWEGGLGYFTTFGRLGKAEVYAGYGRGIIRRYSNNSPEKDYTSRYNRYFIQPAAGFGNQKVSVTGGFRLAYQRFYDFESRDPDLRYNMMRNDRNDIEREAIGFIEPFINAELGWKYIKYNMQVGCSGQILGGNISGVLPIYLSFGIVFNMAPSYLNGADNARPDAANKLFCSHFLLAHTHIIYYL